MESIFNLGADEIEIEPGAFVVYIGSHGDRGAHRADVILPGAAYTEKTGTYVNTEGRPQFAERAIFPPGEAREDWAILRALSDVLGARLPFDIAGALRAAIAAAHPHLAAIDQIAPADSRRSRRWRRSAARSATRRSSRRRRFLLHQPDRAILARDGGMLVPRQGPARRGRGIGPSMSSATPIRPAAPDRSLEIALASRARRARRRRRHRDLSSRGYAASIGHWFHETSLGTFIRYVLESLAMLVGVLLSSAALIYAERKIWASVHLRRGPNVVGPWGVLQPFADFGKFILKEPIIPASANKGVFVLAPLVGVVLAFAALAVIPVNEGWVVGDINVGVLYLFAVSSLGVYGIIMAGWASNSKYPFLSALRSAAQMVSYEVSIGFVIVTVRFASTSRRATSPGPLRLHPAIKIYSLPSCEPIRQLRLA